MRREEDQIKFVYKAKWDKQEDEILKQLVLQMDANKIKWGKVSAGLKAALQNKYAHMRARTNKQCRQRWFNHVNPELKNHLPWTKDQQNTFFKLFESYPHQWSMISLKLQQAGFQRRGDNSIKNYFNLYIKKSLKKMNEVLEQKNKQSKKIKSSLYNYHDKYKYQRRFSIQRSIKSQKNQEIQQSSKLYQEIICQSVDDRQMKGLVNSQRQQFTNIQTLNLKIIKMISFENITKIFQLAQSKTDKYNIKKKQNLTDSVQLRNDFLQFMKNFQILQNEKIIQLACKILDLGKQFKKKTKKQDQSEQEIIRQKPRLSLIVQQKIEDQRVKLQFQEQQGKDFFRQQYVQLNCNQKKERKSLSVKSSKKQDFQYKNKKNNQGLFGQAFKNNQTFNIFENPLASSIEFPIMNFNLQKSNEYGALFKPIGPQNSSLDAGVSPQDFNQFNYATNPDAINCFLPYFNWQFDNKQGKSGMPISSQAIDLLQSQKLCKLNRQMSKQAQYLSNVAQMSFLNSIKQIQPNNNQGVQTSQKLFFDMDLPQKPFSNSSSSWKPFSRIKQFENVQYQNPPKAKSIFSQIGCDKKSSSEPINKQQQQFFAKSTFMLYNSWAYSTPSNMVCNTLFNSYNYQQTNGVQMRNSLVQPRSVVNHLINQ